MTWVLGYLAIGCVFGGLANARFSLPDGDLFVRFMESKGFSSPRTKIVLVSVFLWPVVLVGMAYSAGGPD